MSDTIPGPEDRIKREREKFLFSWSFWSSEGVTDKCNVSEYQMVINTMEKKQEMEI